MGGYSPLAIEKILEHGIEYGTITVENGYIVACDMSELKQAAGIESGKSYEDYKSIIDPFNTQEKLTSRAFMEK